MIINILGIDGVGKTTHIYQLEKDIKETFKINTRVVSKSDIMNAEIFPEANLFRASYEVLATECLPFMRGNSRAMWLLYMFSVIFGKFPPQENEIVLMDGYWHKHYGSEVALGIDGDWLKMVCTMFPAVDFVAMLDIEPEKVILRGKKKLTAYECGLDTECNPYSYIKHQSKMRSLFKDLIKEYNSIIIDSDKLEEEVYKDLKESIFSEILKKFELSD